MLKEDQIIKKLNLEIKKTKATTTKVGKIYLALVNDYPLVKIESKKQNRVALKVIECLMTFVNRNESILGKSEMTQLQQYMICLSDLIERFETKTYPSLSP